MRITSKGQVTIPQALRRKAGLAPHMEVEFSFKDGEIILRKAEKQPDRGRMAVDRLRRAEPRTTLSTDEIMNLTRGEADG